MSLCRYLPTPSERMGILWSLLGIKEAIVLEFGPAGTTHYSVGTVSELGIDVNENLYSTHIDERDVIMGDSKRLEDALLEIDREYKPKYIFVLGSSVSAVIATDLKGICSSMEDTINAKMIPFEGGGFRGDYSLGLKEALNSISEIVKPCSVKKESTFNIIGASSEEYRIKSNIEEIKSIMKECFGFKLGTSFTVDSSITQIENAGSAELNLVIRNEGIEIGEKLQEKTGVPYLYGAPYGYSGTLKWIETIGEIIGKEPSKEYIGRIRKSMGNGRQFSMYKHFMKTPLVASMIGNYDVIKGLSGFFKNDIGFNVGLSLCSHSLKGIKDESEDIKHIASEKERISLIKNCKDSIFLGDDISISLGDDSCEKVKISNPTLEGREYSTHMPIMGYKGADYLLEGVARYINKLMKEM